MYFYTKSIISALKTNLARFMSDGPCKIMLIQYINVFNYILKINCIQNLLISLDGWVITPALMILSALTVQLSYNISCELTKTRRCC